MRPPLCAICGKDFFNEGGLVYFTRRPSDNEWDRRMEEEEMVGHPPYAEWFCGDHYRQAESLKNLTIDKAMETMKG